MSNDIQIRTVTVELLRSGPAHNQLLSPLTLYLGVCDDAEAGIVTLPYEQHTFERRMRALRYDEDAISKDKIPELRALGIDMAKVLGTIPRLAGSLGGDTRGVDTLVHLSLTLSASELAALPFELSKVPIGPTAWTESWLALQSRVPVVITRRTRNVSTRGFRGLRRPRVLFISADPDDENVPFYEHRAAIFNAMRPFLDPAAQCPRLYEGGRVEVFGDEALTITRGIPFDVVARHCAASPYTHIHVLAHGAVDTSLGDSSSGLRLHPDDGVVSGERLASAFAGLVGESLHRPDVVTLATCDSGKPGDPLVPGASIVHALHQAGIPLVLGSQFPLTKEGSVIVAQEFYNALLWGEHPWIVLHRVRSALHGRLRARDHDWASLVVYEALPTQISYDLDQSRYHRGQTAMATARAWQWAKLDAREQDTPDAEAAPDIRVLQEGGLDVEEVIRRLPLDSKYFGMEALALRAQGREQIAADEYYGLRGAASSLALDTELVKKIVLAPASHLGRALEDYGDAVTGFLVNDGQGMNSPYRALVAKLVLSAVLGRGFERGTWEMARHWIKSTLEDAVSVDEKLWSNACVAELWLIRLTEEETAKSPQAVKLAADNAHLAIEAMVRLDRGGQSLAVQRTKWELGHYAAWWGDPDVERVLGEYGVARRASFHRKGASLVDLANALLDIIDPLPPASPPAAKKAAAKGKATPGAVVPAPAPLKAATAVAPKPNATAALLGSSAASSKAPATARATAGAGGATFFNIEMLPAAHGDALFIEYGRVGAAPSRVLVDCGTDGSYKDGLKKRIEALGKTDRHFELFMMSHIDFDHIGGAIPFLQEAPALGVSFGDVWFNGWKHIASMLGGKQGEKFSALIVDNKLPWNEWNNGKGVDKGKAIVRPGGSLPTITLPGGMLLTLLSPTKEKLAALAPKWAADIKDWGTKPGDLDAARSHLLGKHPSTSENVDELADAPFKSDTAEPNGSSIAVLAEYGGKSILLGADAHAPVLVEAIKILTKSRGLAKLPLTAFKVSHHASQNNLNIELMKLLDCKHYLISTNGGTFNHPDREAIGRVIKYGGTQPKLWFNFRSKINEVWAKPALQQKYHYDAAYPEGERPGLLVRL